jgi:WD40 repeat protein/serine/threonine protein kinase
VTATPSLDTVFSEAIELLSPSDRAAYIARACGADVALRDRVEELVAAHFRAGRFLEAPAPELAPTIDQPAPEGPGTVIGPYRLMEQVGEGGMGVVFVAEQHYPVRRKVALKVIKPGMDTKEVVARFEAERQALALMDHPHIARVLDAGVTDRGRPFFVMELVRGIPITDYCDRAHMGVRERLGLFVQVCQAVQHAHQKGVIHRDLKPTNVLVTEHDGTPVAKVIDFGVAKAVGQSLTDKTVYTRHLQLVGSPLYMSPEQAGLSGLDVDTRADIYALGVLLYELLTGTTPFDKERFRTAAYDEVRQIIREEEPPTPSTRLSTLGRAAVTVSANRGSEPRKLSALVKGELDWLVMKALEKDRNRRYESAAAFAADVQRYLSDEPVLACPPSAVYRFRKFARRNRGGVLAGAGAGLALLLAVGSALVVEAANTAQIKDKHRETTEALDREKQTNDALHRALNGEQRALYFRRIALAAREVEARNVGRVAELLEECPIELRGWEWHYLNRRCRQEPFTYREHPGLVSAIAVSPDGKTVASTSIAPLDAEPKLREIHVWDRSTGRRIHRLTGNRAPVKLAFHPKGKVLFSAGEDGILRAWDMATGEPVRELKAPAGAVALAVSQDGRLLATACTDNAVRIWDADDFNELRRLGGHTRLVHGVEFGPAGRLVTAGFDGTARVWDTTTGQEVHILRGHAGPVFGVAYRRDGAQIASCGLDGTTRVWDARTGRHLRTLQTDETGLVAVAFSPDGRRLATGSLSRAVRVWDPEADQESLTLRGHTDVVWGVAFSPDGDQLVSFGLDGTVRVWDGTPLSAAPEPGQRTLRGHAAAVLSVAFRPGPGRAVLASGSRDQTVRFWDPATGQEIRTLLGHAGPVYSLSFSRDGRRVATTDFSGTIKVRNADTGKDIRTFHGIVARAALSPDGRRVAFTAQEATVEVRDVDTGEEILAPFRAHAAPVMALAFSPDGKRLATAGWDRAAAIWDAGTGRLLHKLTGHQHSVMTIEFSNDGTRLLTASWDKTLKLWDAATGKEIRSFVGHEDIVSDAALSPDGNWLASASGDFSVRVWDVDTGEAVTILRGHTGHVLSVAFSPDGKRLASSSGYRGKGEVKVWDATPWSKKPDGK